MFDGIQLDPFHCGTCPRVAPPWSICGHKIFHDGLGGGEVISTVPISRAVLLVGTSQ
jgi:hypothetical protein